MSNVRAHVQLSRVASIAISVTAWAVGALLLMPGVLLLAADFGGFSAGALFAAGIYLGAGTLVLMAGIGLFRELAWSRWLLLVTTCLLGTLLLWQVIAAAGFYQRLGRTSSATLDPQVFAQFFGRAYAPFFGAFVLAALATLFAFRHFRAKNI